MDWPRAPRCDSARRSRAPNERDRGRGLATDGTFEQPSAEVEAAGEGVRAVYRLVPRARATSLEFAGNRASEAKDERSHLDVNEGDVFDPVLIDAGAEAAIIEDGHALHRVQQLGLERPLSAPPEGEGGK